MLTQFLKSLVGHKPAEQIDAWLALAKEQRKAGEPREAIATYRKALKAGAPAAETHLQLGVLHAELSEHAAAIDELKKTIDPVVKYAHMQEKAAAAMDAERASP